MNAARLQGASLRQTKAPPGMANRMGLGLRLGLSLGTVPSTLDRRRWFQHPFQNFCTGAVTIERGVDGFGWRDWGW